MTTLDQDKEKIAKMPRKELNAEVLHCWREQAELTQEIAKLKEELSETLPSLCTHEIHDVIHDVGLCDDKLETLKKALKEACCYLRQAEELIQDSGMIEPEDEEPGYLPSVIEWEKLCS